MKKLQFWHLLVLLGIMFVVGLASGYDLAPDPKYNKSRAEWIEECAKENTIRFWHEQSKKWKDHTQLYKLKACAKVFDELKF